MIKNIKKIYEEVYLVQLVNILNENKFAEFKNIEFQKGEANTDVELKEALKNFILHGNNQIKGISKVEIDGEIINLKDKYFYIEEIKYGYGIGKTHQKENTIRVKPDLQFICKLGKENFQFDVELKSTLNDNIPGSSVRQVDEELSVIFLRHSKETGNLLFTYGKYKDSILGITFPDRSPRVKISFSRLHENFIHKYKLNLETETLVISKDIKDTTKKFLHVENWRKIIFEQWLEMLYSESKNNETWFKPMLKTFIINLLEKEIIGKSEEEQRSFVNKIKETLK